MSESDASLNNAAQTQYSITVSGDLIVHVRLIYMLALSDFNSRGYPRKGINCGTPHALPAYVLAVAAFEAFINEEFIAQSHLFPADSPLRHWKKKGYLYNMELIKKLKRLARLSGGKTLPSDTPALQDLQLLTDIRHDLVHYEMKGRWPKYMETLLDRQIALNALESHQAFEPWPRALSTSEGIRWANNTVCAMAHIMHRLLPQSYRKHSHGVENFKVIDNTFATTTLLLKGIDPDSSHTP